MQLDIGCGSGYYQKHSKHRGQVNLDVLKPVKKIPNFVLGDAHYLPFKSKAFDTVYFLDVIEHVENPVQCLREIKRVTNGVIYLGTPNALFFLKIARTILKGSYKVYPDHIVTYGVSELSQLLNRVGFTDFKAKATTYRDRARGKFYTAFSRLVPAPLRGRQIIATIYNKEKSKKKQVLVSFIITTCTKDTTTIDSLKNCPFPHEIVISRKAGLGYARNYGASIARGKILVFLDDYLKIYFSIFDHIATMKKGTFKIAYQAKMPATRCLIIYKEDFEKVWFSDEIKLSGEDREFFMYAVKSGLDYLFLSPKGLYQHQEHERRFKRNSLTSITMMYEHAKVLATHGAYMRFYTGFLIWLIPYWHKTKGKKAAKSYGSSAFYWFLRDCFLVFAVLTLRRYRKN